MNVLLNPGFEDGVTDPWHFYAYGSNMGSFSVTPDVYSGNFAGILTCTAFDGVSAIYAGQQVIDRVALDGPRYIAKCKYKSTADFMLRVHVFWGTGQGITYQTGVLPPSANWKEVVLNIPAPFPADSYDVLFYVRIYGVGTVTFDDCVMEETVIPPTSPWLRVLYAAVKYVGPIVVGLYSIRGWKR